MQDNALTLAEIADRYPPTALPAVRLPDHRRGIVLGRSDTGQFIEIGTGGIVIPHKPSTTAELITDPAARAFTLTDAFAGTRKTYLWQCHRANRAEQRLADERNERILRDLQLQQFLGQNVDTGRLHTDEAEQLLAEQFAPLPQPRLRVTVAFEGTFDIEGIPDGDQLADFGDLLTADVTRIRNTVSGGSEFQIAPGADMRLSVTNVERLSDPAAETPAE